MNWKSVESVSGLRLSSANLNFPYYYRRGFIWYWRILNFHDTGYLNIVFTNVSFNIYKVRSYYSTNALTKTHSSSKSKQDRNMTMPP